MPDESESRSNEHSAEHDTGATGNDTKPTPVEPIETRSATIARDIEHKNADVHGGPSDQQQSISEQAFVDRIRKSDRWMIALTAVIAIGGAVSAAIFGFQLSAMRGQLDEMRVQRISGQRAFINVNGVEFEPIPFLLQKGIFWMATPIVENSGNSPTVGLIAITHCTSSFNQMNDPAEIEKTNLLYNMRSSDFRHMVFGPKQVAKGGFCPVSALNAMLSIVPGNIHLYVYGMIIYHDIFDREHWHETYYCFDSTDFAVGENASNPTMTAFTFPCRSRNCVDEDCSAEQQAAAANFMERKIKVFRMPTPRYLAEKALRAAQAIRDAQKVPQAGK